MVEEAVQVHDFGVNLRASVSCRIVLPVEFPAMIARRNHAVAHIDSQEVDRTLLIASAIQIERLNVIKQRLRRGVTQICASLRERTWSEVFNIRSTVRTSFDT